MLIRPNNMRALAAFLAGWIAATFFSAAVAYGLPATAAIGATLVMAGLFVVASMVYDHFLAVGRSDVGADLDVGQVPLPTTAALCEAYSATHFLTPRQGEVCLLLVEGKSLDEIADELCISKETVKSHVKAVYAKAGIHSRQELLAAVYVRVTRDAD